MQDLDIGRPSRWMIRAMEWDDARARYPNIWHQQMPRHILALERLAGRLRLGDLVVVYYPSSTRHPERSERFIGICRVSGLRRAERPDHAWIDLETAHRFDPPLDLGRRPRKVFMCCDPGWPAADVMLFRSVVEAAMEAGWRSTPDVQEVQVGRGEELPQREPPADKTAAPPEAATRAVSPPPAARERIVKPEGERRPTKVEVREVSPGARVFGGVAYSGDMRDPREATWLALVELRNGRLEVVRLDPTGRSGLQSCLRDPDRSLMQAEAIGLDFPFGLPEPFAQSLLGGTFPEEGWWALARRFERLTRPDYLVALHDFREAHGEVKRLTDEQAQAFSPLHRAQPDLGPMTYHGIRMIAEDRSRYAIRPFETAQGRRLLEVYPEGLVRRLGLGQEPGESRRQGQILSALTSLATWPVEVPEPFRKRCLQSGNAPLDAVIAARCAARAVLNGQADLRPEELAPNEAARVRREGWIYGLEEPA